ncbi:kinase-like domain-containing protein [Desarmillaria tabescens]|uniref:Kinase-like domain-containing protein n=1 Tax=Armillaria tabescens TaxID=1929756 RepID=A0AA39JHP5_ARMTA|nr:kinase-like domain-containing protein [Desarmillaria tabescens]KAK0441504.1 kinase-like domain-containing protein [Desarmillaria tabescens]
MHAQSSDIDHLTDEQVLGLCYAVPSEAWDKEESPTGMLPHITSGIVAKSMLIPVDGMPSEALILNLVHEATNIPVPQVRRVVTSHFKAVILMDYIPGARLSDVWHELSLFRKIRVAMTLRSYILQLRSIRHPRALIPGPMASGNRAMTCWSPRIFGTMIESRGPFASYDDLSSFFNTRQTMSLGASSELENFDDSSHLVLVHHDLNMRNIILGDDGQIWLIDWGWSGFYPPWWEYVSMKKQAEKNWAFMVLFIPFICDPFFRQDMWLKRMRRC